MNERNVLMKTLAQSQKKSLQIHVYVDMKFTIKNTRGTNLFCLPFVSRALVTFTVYKKVFERDGMRNNKFGNMLSVAVRELE